ncbi:AAA family ATPase [Olsenella sp. YH-ols2221]|uniref:ATP-binding protein n=1 Tax=Olsenella kribbiana TaxID=3115221 RepID=UPI002ED8A120
MKDLEAWAASPCRTPLIVGGARQVGKTWLLKEFGRTHYDAVAHIAFHDNEVMKRAFDGTLNPDRLLTAIGTYTSTNPTDGRTLVFLDDIQECPRAITSLKVFCEDRPDVPVVAAGSLLGTAQNRSTKSDERISWLAGKVDYLDIHPMTFTEFLMALGEGHYADLLKIESLGDACAMSEHYDDLLKLYFYVGGMPEAVQAYCDNHLLEESRKVQLRLLKNYERDISENARTAISADRIWEAWQSVPLQLFRKTGNGKFM